jgi:hypothetical protein
MPYSNKVEVIVTPSKILHAILNGYLTLQYVYSETVPFSNPPQKTNFTTKIELHTENTENGFSYQNSIFSEKKSLAMGRGCKTEQASVLTKQLGTSGPGR